MIAAYSCAACGAPVSPSAAATTTACAICGKPWRRGPRAARVALDVAGIRSSAGEAAQAADVEALTVVAMAHVPALLGLVGELTDAIAALCGPCTCRPVRLRTRKVGPCPHYRAGMALMRAGVSREDLAALRNKIDRKVT